MNERKPQRRKWNKQHIKGVSFYRLHPIIDYWMLKSYCEYTGARIVVAPDGVKILQNAIGYFVHFLLVYLSKKDKTYKGDVDEAIEAFAIKIVRERRPDLLECAVCNERRDDKENGILSERRR